MRRRCSPSGSTASWRWNTPRRFSKLFVDNEKIAWVVTNLLSNAIHHSPENFAHHRGSLPAGQGREYLRAGFRPGESTRATTRASSKRYFRVPGTKVQGSRSGTGYFEGVRRSARRHDHRGQPDRQGQSLYDLPSGLIRSFGVIFGGAAGFVPAAFFAGGARCIPPLPHGGAERRAGPLRPER